MTSQNDSAWTAACAYDRPAAGPRRRGAAARRHSGGAVPPATTDRCYAVGNIDPFSGAAVMSRGIVGDRAGRAVRAERRSRSRPSLLTTAAAWTIRTVSTAGLPGSGLGRVGRNQATGVGRSRGPERTHRSNRRALSRSTRTAVVLDGLHHPVGGELEDQGGLDHEHGCG